MAFDLGMLDTSPGALIRSGAGVLSLLLGVFVLSLRPRRRFNRLLGTLLLLNFVNFAVFALGGQYREPPPLELLVPTLSITSLGSLASTGLVVVMAFDLFREAGTPVRQRVAYAAAAAIVLAGLLVAFNQAYGFDAVRARIGSDLGTIVKIADGNAYSAFTVSLGMLLLALVANAKGHRPAAPVAALLVAATGLFMDPASTAGYMFSEFAKNTERFLLPLLLWGGLAVLALLGTSLSLLRFAGGPHGRLAIGGMLVLLITAAVELFVDVVLRDISSTVGGVAQVLGMAMLGYAIFRLDLLGVPLPRVRLRASTVATAGLAALFVTAQVAQNLLSSSELGLIWGGVVAGVVVFAAFPLQKAAERAVERKKHEGEDSPASKYRRLVETAWADGHLGANERLLLSESMTMLGVDAETARRIDDDVARSHTQRRIA